MGKETGKAKPITQSKWIQTLKLTNLEKKTHHYSKKKTAGTLKMYQIREQEKIEALLSTP